MRSVYEQAKKMVAESRRMSIEEVPDWRVKTPLQRAIQILKRHRDIMFGEDETKPISIIITTLAAKAYNQEDNVYQALVSIINGMEKHIEFKYDEGKQIVWIENPVNPEENFADKWEHDDELPKSFLKWLSEAKKDILYALEKAGLHNIQKELEESFGKQVVNEAFMNLGYKSKALRESGEKKMAIGLGIMGDTGRTTVRDHDNFGSLEDE